MKHTTIKSIVAAALCAVGSVAFATPAPEKDFEFKDGTIIKYNGSDSTVEIPSTIGGENVTSIGDCAFEDCDSLTSVTIPLGVTSIGDDAFYDCDSLTSVTIPLGVTSIGDCAFYDCSSLKSVTIPLGVTSIGECAFENCGSLTSVTIPSSVTEVGDSAFAGCGSLDLVVGNGTDGCEIAFYGDVEVSSVEVKANANVSFECLSAETIVNAGTVEFGELYNLFQPISNSGVVMFTADFEAVDVDGGFVLTAGEPGYYDLENNFSSVGNGYFGTLPSFVTVVDGGTVVGEVTVIYKREPYALNNSGQALDDGEVEYDTFYVFEDTVKTSDINGDEKASRVEVVGGTLDVDASPDFEIIVVNIATVTGDELDPCAIQIADGAMVNFVDGFELDGVEFRAAEGGCVSVYNDGDDTVPYTPGNSDMEVTAQSIVKTSGEDATVSNWLNVDEIVNEQDCTLTLDGMGEEAQVKKITVGMDGIVEILRAPYDDEATVTVTDELTAAGGTLFANLKMADGSALLVKGEQKALHVGSTLAMGEDIKLDTATLKALDALNVGDSFWLIDAASGRELSYEGEYGEDAWYYSMFSRTSYEGDYRLRGNFNIVFDDMEGFGLKKVVEPIQVGNDAYVEDLDGVTWGEKVPTRIVIRGTGSADGFPADFDRYAVKVAVVEDGITEIGARFFKDFNNLEILQLGKDVAKVGEKAFLYCMSLESIEIENPNFDLSSLDGAINYHTAVNSDGSLYPIPNVTVKGCQQTLEGKANLTDANWTDLGAVVPGKPMSDYTGYHFFRIVLKKIEE